MANTTKDVSEFSTTELFIQQQMRVLGMEACLYTWDQSKGHANIETSVSFYSEDMSLEEQSLCGYLCQHIKDKGLNQINKTHNLLCRMQDGLLVISESSY